MNSGSPTAGPRYVAGAGGVLLLCLAALVFLEFEGAVDILRPEGGVLTIRSPSGGALVRTPIRSGEVRPIMFLVAGAAGLIAALCAVAVARPRRFLLRIWRAKPGGLQGLVAALAALAVLTAYVPVGGEMPMLGVYFAIATTGYILVLSGFWPVGLRAAARWERARDESAGGVPMRRRSPVSVALALAAASFIVANLVSWIVFRHRPHVVDGVSQLFQARIFDAGHLYLPSPPLREFFHLQTVVNNGRWYSQYPPMHSALLALLEPLGLPWILNPLLGAGAVFVVFLLGREVYDERTAMLGALLAAVSPFIVLISSEFYNHATSLLASLLFMLFYARTIRTGRLSQAALAGLFWTAAFLARPLTAAAVAAPFALDGAARLAAVDRHRYRWGLVTLAGAMLLGAGLLLTYNQLTTGSAFTFGYRYAMGDRLEASGGFSNTLERLRLLNDALFGWPVPGLVLMLAAFLGGTPRRWDYLAAGVLASLLAAHFLWGYQANEFGPRYLYEATGAVALLSARGFARIPEAVQRFAIGPIDPGRVRRAASISLAAALILGAIFGWAPRLALYRSQRWLWSLRDEPLQAVRAAGIHRAVVFVADKGDTRRYASVFLENRVDLDASDVIYVHDLGPRNEELMRRYPNRRFFRTESLAVTEIHPQAPASSQTEAPE